ncbi:related to uroporphyrinogen III synthase [Fusarium fujikuroi]|uniref:Related to uroporphyrinogen III synthase n=1 Tax=Gibberella fujikuroi (strain CBS 195.34 / IMI 58289 / NRRL A-6831) TaxID=1279085 RepID=S0DY81_GIBF5|nr:related to uroporphyrinogen III synthase [Fusarium fujikuroi IMI 58289]KLO91538.1 uroporphyrinogen III synthase [Fusarium fujikuroi]KLO98797.1 uroporphyrinogen III synthase [Fusarium fujikuroi]KLP06945.1 uroporphyrinogen III synthase [Fusarium fujikuroi]CCT67415.1 related to uroporphyrinogen III synthase [Fusarium fujikuroi IMI 58289]SCN90297.1 related to uroporphyrinogen III synthase [Fusarium fujikuroi]
MTTTNPTTEQASEIPVLLLKTRSSPGDSYEDLFSESNVNASGFAPQFVPVLLHQFHSDGMNEVAALLRDRRIGNQKHHEYGGLIFTSQRAVEAFVKLVEDGKADDIPKPEEKTSWPHLQNIPVYSVGPATTRALAAVPQEPPLQVFGSHTGNGAALAPFILAHYYEWYGGQKRATLPPILFLVGETRRDIIPKTLQDGALPDTERIRVTETVVYGTGVMESFPVDLRRVLGETRNDSMRWIVVFSPTGCDSMLRVMGILDPETNKVYKGYERDGKTFIATIGPTTRDHLLSFGFEPDVCAELPTPQGVLEGIQAFMVKRQS